MVSAGDRARRAQRGEGDPEKSRGRGGGRGEGERRERKNERKKERKEERKEETNEEMPKLNQWRINGRLSGAPVTRKPSSLGPALSLQPPCLGQYTLPVPGQNPQPRQH